jgi:hypothetical protein
MRGRELRAVRWIMVAAGLCAAGPLLTADRAPAQEAKTVSSKAAPGWHAEIKRVPQPRPVVTEDTTKLVEFETAPFPYDGVVPATDKPFLDVTEEERRGHRGMRGQIFWEDETYNDRRVLLHLPKGFDPRRPALMIVFFHGHSATLERDVVERQQVAAQISRSGINAVLVAPQFAHDAADSSAGKFWQRGVVARFMVEMSETSAILRAVAVCRMALVSLISTMKVD